MYGSILTFLIAIAIQALAPRGGPDAWTLVEGLHILVYPLLVWAALRFRFRRLMARALHDAEAARALRIRFSSLVQAYQTALLLPFALLIYATGYPALVMAPVASTSQALESALGVFPYVVFLFLLWWEAYPLQGVLLGHEGSRARFALAHGRMELPVLVPWLVIMGAMDLLRALWPGGYRALEANPLLQLLYAPLFLVLLGIFLPVLIKAMWGCEPVPPSPLRERLTALCRDLRLRVGEILFWPLLEGRVMTAGIVGLLPRYRYLLVTPALAEVLTPEELEGVVAHEAGHVKYRHLGFYLFLFVGYVCLATVFFRLALAVVDWWGLADPRALQQPRANLYVSLGLTAGLLVLLFAYFRVLFGAVSRAFERQADLYALEAIGRPGPLISALERIAYHSGDIRDLPSWHHGSIAERVSFLTGAWADPELLRGHHRKVRRLTWGFLGGVLVLATTAVALHTDPLDRKLDLFVAEQALLHRVEQHPDEGGSWFALGNLYFEIGREPKAAEAYRRAITATPNHPEALNNLAWLYLTTRDPELYRPERALALVEMAVTLKPAPHILDTLAEARYRIHDLPGAVKAIEAALAQNPENRDYYLGQRRKFLAELEGS